MLPEYASKQILAQLGIAVPPGRLASSCDEAIAIAHEIGFPVALKAQASDLPHKSSAGAVVLGVASEPALNGAWAKLHRRIEEFRPGISLDGVLVERMEAPGCELIAGSRNDPQWGPVLLVGFGGVLAEAIRDTRLIPPDLSPAAIEHELLQLRSSDLLKGFRGSPPLDVRAAAEVISRIGDLVRSWPNLLEIDINPLVVYPRGSGAIALDALIALGPHPAQNNIPTHEAIHEPR
jgi:acyl-CoA synthetase (NDP forming)